MSLSLLASYDDLVRLATALGESSCEPEFIRFAINQEECRKKWLAAVQETQRLQRELEKSNRNNAVLDAKLNHARRILDKEKKERHNAETYASALEKKLQLVRDLVFIEGCGKINDETREKLGFLHATCNSFAGNDEEHGGGQIRGSRLHTITEARDSTGSMLSDLSYSRSEDDLDVTLTRSGKVWKRHRPSLTACDEVTSSKRQCTAVEKSVELNGVEMNAEKVVATTTLTIGKEGGPIKASAKLEAVPNNESRRFRHNEREVKNHCNYGIPSVPLQPTAPPRDFSSDESGGCPGQVNLLTPRSTRVGSNTGAVHTLAMSNKLNSRPHIFYSKSVIYPEQCTPCGKRMKFGKMALKCGDCRTMCHPECKEQVPLPCVPVGNTPTRRGAMGTISDYTPHTAPMVPSLIVHCVNEVELRGMNEVGIYRVPGADRDVKGLKEKFLRGKGVPNLSNIDIHTICGAIKEFLRSLQDPLVTRTLWQDFVKAAEASDPDDARAAVIQAVSELPQPNRDTLAFMILHLQRVAASPDCKMPAPNLTKIFGPTIVGYSKIDGLNPPDMLKETRQQTMVVEHLMNVPSDYWANFVNVDSRGYTRPPEIFFTPSKEYALTPVCSSSRVDLTPYSSSFRRRSRKYFGTITSK